ncbi:DUF6907 domain-containing protein [Actinoplanes teichomyceticus]|uniref:Uncharacterized protein n=1 Tax=Actinoplanes teichomyceticus TaxID=1867 RepID=A0A561WI90_ACTTI|nr:hypothetical protein [Actinoplanes teichomyceticus]TWG23597.1 hypothetical protein FHX34_102146 [Actinoplanes teichomyceticus]GIF11635.1 hypothetical protein Ate01nite_16670 [Actinoplanes teichomyceticus]
MTGRDEKGLSPVETPGAGPWTRAQFLRVGTQVMTEDGWQTIRGLVIFADADQVTVFTPQRDDEWTGGWRFRFNEMVRYRDAAPADGCPAWCTEHYDGGERRQQRCHSSFPQSVPVADVYAGTRRELGVWLERRDDRETGVAETVGILEVRRLAEDVELTPDAMRQLAELLQQLADQADGRRR